MSLDIFCSIFSFFISSVNINGGSSSFGVLGGSSKIFGSSVSSVLIFSFFNSFEESILLISLFSSFDPLSSIDPNKAPTSTIDPSLEREILHGPILDELLD